MFFKVSAAAIALLLFVVACGSGSTPTATKAPVPTATTAAVSTATLAPTATKAPTPGTIATATTPPTAVATSTPQPKPTTPPGTSTPAAAAPQGTLTVAQALVGVGNEWVPSTFSETSVRLAWQTVRETLMAVGPDGSVQPRLATGWEMREDGKAWKFTLKKGVQFQESWGEFTSADVKASWERATRDDSRYSRKAVAINIGKVIETPDPYTIIFRPGTLQFDVFSMFTVPQASANLISMESKKYVESVGDAVASRHPVGTGPWAFAEQKANESLKVAAVQNHWRKTPAFANTIFMEVPEEATRTALLQTNKADIVQVPLESAKKLGDAGFKSARSKDAVFTYIVLGGQFFTVSRPGYNANLPWVGNGSDPQSLQKAKLVRQALSVAINRDEIAKSLFSGFGRPLNAWGPWLGPLAPYAKSTWVQTYSPSKAKDLLAQAGYPSGFKIDVLLHDNLDNSAGRLATEAVGSLYWPAIGINVALQNRQIGQLNPDYIARKSTWAGSFTNAAYDDPLQFWSVVTTTKATFNLGAEYPALDDMIAKGVATMDLNARQQIWMQVGDWLNDNQPYIPLVAVDVVWPVSSRVGNWPLMGFGTFYLNNLEYITPA